MCIEIIMLSLMMVLATPKKKTKMQIVLRSKYYIEIALLKDFSFLPYQELLIDPLTHQDSLFGTLMFQ